MALYYAGSIYDIICGYSPHLYLWFNRCTVCVRLILGSQNEAFTESFSIFHLMGRGMGSLNA